MSCVRWIRDISTAWRLLIRCISMLKRSEFNRFAEFRRGTFNDSHCVDVEPETSTNRLCYGSTCSRRVVDRQSKHHTNNTGRSKSAGSPWPGEFVWGGHCWRMQCERVDVKRFAIEWKEWACELSALQALAATAFKAPMHRLSNVEWTNSLNSNFHGIAWLNRMYTAWYQCWVDIFIIIIM